MNIKDIVLYKLFGNITGPRRLKSWLDFVYYELGRQKYNFYLNKLTKEQDGGIKATKWKKYSELCFVLDADWIDGIDVDVNQRQILPCELVFDFEDWKSYWDFTRLLEKTDIDLYVLAYKTHSRGVHVHMFEPFARPFQKEVYERIIKFVGADVQKLGAKSMIALEFAPHWKSGKPKELIYANVRCLDLVGGRYKS